MRLSKFSELMADEFGMAYAQVIIDDLVLGELGDRTAAEAIKAGDDVRLVWQAICAANGVPKERWHGKAKLKPKS